MQDNLSNLLREAAFTFCNHEGMKPLELKLADACRLLIITWDNGEISRLSAPELRRHSRSATAIRAQLDQPDMLGHAGQDDGLCVTGIEPIGGYAVRLHFSDGHDRGIYPWAHLRDIADGSAETAT